MPTLIGKGRIVNLSGGALAIASLSGYVSPNLQTLRLSHATEAKTSKNQSGVTEAAYYADEILEITVDFIPSGTTVANAKLSAGLPAPGSPVAISGLPIFVVGSFADALNTNGATTNPWIYEGGGSFNLPHDGEATMTLPLKRFSGITSATALT